MCLFVLTCLFGNGLESIIQGAVQIGIPTPIASTVVIIVLTRYNLTEPVHCVRNVCIIYVPCSLVWIVSIAIFGCRRLFTISVVLHSIDPISCSLCCYRFTLLIACFMLTHLWCRLWWCVWSVARNGTNRYCHNPNSFANKRKPFCVVGSQPANNKSIHAFQITGLFRRSSQVFFWPSHIRCTQRVWCHDGAASDAAYSAIAIVQSIASSTYWRVDWSRISNLVHRSTTQQ